MLHSAHVSTTTKETEPTVGPGRPSLGSSCAAVERSGICTRLEKEKDRLAPVRGLRCSGKAGSRPEALVPVRDAEVPDGLGCTSEARPAGPESVESLHDTI
jgi:hypothetical protein